MNNFFQFLKSRTFFINILLAVVLLIFLLAFVYKWLNGYTRHGETLTVPDLRGQQIKNLDRFLEFKNLNYHIADSSIFDPTLPPGTVIEQDPKPAEKVKENRTIYISITRSIAPEIKMPDLIDVSYRQAEAILHSYGLKVGEIIYKPDLAKNAVLSMQIKGYTLKPSDVISKGSTIDLVLGDGYGNTQVEVPNLYNFTLNEALFILKGSALNAGRIEYDGTVLDTLAARIYRQTPAYGDSVFISQGQIIDLFLTNSKVVLDKHIK
ncbi:MAG: PASTA domain-containing protein [Bacteroidia bacterium]|nr:PASTA domain-containing protein [Bacteroidia bacterium]